MNINADIHDVPQSTRISIGSASICAAAYETTHITIIFENARRNFEIRWVFTFWKISNTQAHDGGAVVCDHASLLNHHGLSPGRSANIQWCRFSSVLEAEFDSCLRLRFFACQVLFCDLICKNACIPDSPTARLTVHYFLEEFCLFIHRWHFRFYEFPLFSELVSSLSTNLPVL